MNKKIFTALLCLWPILNTYSYQTGGLLGLGDLCIMIYALFNFQVCRKIKFYKDTIYYFIFLVALTVFSLADSCLIGDKGEGFGSIASLVRIAFYSLIIIIYIPKCMDLEYGIQFIKWFTVVNSAIIYLQTLLYMLIGKVTLLLFPVFPLANGETYTKMYSSLVAHSGSYYFRASSVFSEPAHFAQYALIAILLFLYTHEGVKNINGKKDFWLALFCSGAAILSTSSIGIIFTVAIWAYWSLTTLFRRYIPASLLKSLAFIIPICLIAFLYIIRRLNVFSILMGKLNFSTITDSSSSFAYRVTRGFEIYTKLPLREKLFGVGFGNILPYMQSTDSLTQYAVSDYMNSLAYILCSVGIIGGILFIIVFYKVTSRNHFLRLFTLYIFAMTCCASIFSSDIWVVFMGIYIMSDKVTLNRANKDMQYG